MLVTTATVGIIVNSEPLDPLGGFGGGPQPNIDSRPGGFDLLGRVIEFGRLDGFGGGPQPNVPNTEVFPLTFDDLVSYIFSAEQIITSDSFEEARNIALNELGEIDPSTRKQYIGRLGVGLGKVVGFTTRVDGEFKRYRLDYDPIKGPHINVEVGRGNNTRKTAVTFPGTESDVKARLRELNN